MSSTRSMLAWQAEDHMVEDWEEAPPEARQQAESLLEERMPVAIAKHPVRGWMVLTSQGHGPVIAWSEKELPF